MSLPKVRLGRTGLEVTRTAFGALPIQRLSKEEAVALLLRAADSGINFFDTAHGYTDSEEKLGLAFSDRREGLIIATKTPATKKKFALENINTSLYRMKTDYIDLIQLHNPSALPDPNDPDSSYAGLVEAKKQGKVRFIGITQHSLELAIEAARSGLYDTVQFPLSPLSSDEDLTLIEVCREHNVGLIAMKAMAGGLITNPATSYSFLRQFENVVPIWGIQRENELDDFLGFEEHPPLLDEAMLRLIEEDRRQLTGSFCRGCGYCLPCPVEIPIPMAARMSLLLRRAPYQTYITPEWQANMKKIDSCIHCNACKSRCPYGLDTPALLEENYADYHDFLEKLNG